ncbi:MAG TPA: Gfo/Idh/MocA family oxidoreductase [Pirellulaceae bacterium]|nr:Gfo/Idh/MocA family oxidoreductase [Pirellulaceae bacterium]
MSRIATVVVGAGHLGRIHTRLACSLESLDVIGVIDPDPAARERVGKEFGTPTFASIDELSRMPEAAIVAAPTALHHQLGRRFLAEGIHVLMEKPITVDSRQAAELIDLAQRSDAVLQVGHVERFNPAFRRLSERIERAKFVQTRRLSEYTFRSTDVGVVLDLMIHDLDLVLSLIEAPVTKVDAVGISIMGDHEDIAQARLEFEDGSVATLEASRCSFTRERSVTAFSDRAFARADLTAGAVRSIAPDPDLLARAVPFLSLDASVKDQVKSELFSRWLPLVDEQVTPSNAILDEQADFARAIRGDRRPTVDGRQGMRALQVAERILDEIREHAWHGRSIPVRGPLAGPLPRVVGQAEPSAEKLSVETPEEASRRRAG